MKVLVIGGGVAGLTACTGLRKLNKEVEITLVEPKDYIEIHWASIRNIFDPNMAEESTFDLKSWAVSKAVTTIRQTVQSLTDTQATFANGKTFSFDIAVVCTGAKTKIPALGRGPPSGKAKGSGNLERRIGQLNTERDKFLLAKSVLIVGGGLVGVELAGDIAYHQQQDQRDKAKVVDKKKNEDDEDSDDEETTRRLKITLVHSQERLCSELSAPAAELVREKLQRLGVQVLLNEKVIKDGDQLMLRNGNRRINAEKVLWATGFFSCNSFLDSQYLDRRGWIQVDDYFRIRGAENRLFAVGDCCDLLPNSGSQVLSAMAVIGHNLNAAIVAAATADYDNIERGMRKALEQPDAIVTTLGRETGVAQWGCIHTQFFLPWRKNSTMFLDKPKKALGLR